MSPAIKAGLGEWTQAVLIAANLVWTLGTLGGYRAESMAVTSALTGGLLAVYAVTRSWTAAKIGRASHPAGWWLLPFLFYAAANAAWISPVPWLAWADWSTWAQATAVFWVTLNGVHNRGPRRLLWGALVAAAIGAVFAAGYQRFVDPSWLPLGRTQAPQFHGRGSGTFGSPNSLAALLLLVLPAALALGWRRGAGATARIGWSWVAAVLVLGLVLTASRGAWLGLGAALALWPLLRVRRSWRGRLAGAVAAAGVFALASAGILSTAETVRERTAALVRDGGERSRPILWRAAWELFRTAPVWGTGAGTFNVFFDRQRPERFPEEPQWAHNDYLNTLSDYGAVGVLLWLGGAAGAIRAGLRRTVAGGGERRDALERSWVRQGMGVGLLAFALQAGVDFHFKLPGLAMAFAAVAALAMRPADRASAPPNLPVGRWRRWAGGAIALTVLVGAVPPAVSGYRAEAERSLGRELIDSLSREPADPGVFRATLERARAHLEIAVMLAPRHGGAWADLSYALALFSRVERGRDDAWGKHAEVAAERALALSEVCFEAWVRRGVARDLQGLWYEAGRDFARAVQTAPNNATAWFYQADHFSRRATGLQLAEGALAICLRLDPWNGPGLALRQRLAISLRVP